MYKKIFSLTIVLLILINITYIASAQEHTLLKKATNVEPSKEWKINFNKEISSTTLHDCIYIIDKDTDSYFPINPTLSKDEKSILLKHNQNFQEGHNYELFIKEIKTKDGLKTLSKGIVFPFEIKKNIHVEEKFNMGNSVSNILNGGLAVQCGEYIYYSNIYDNDSLYKMNSDGSEKVKLNNEETMYMNILGDWIYYISKDGIHKIKTDGSENKIIKKVNNGEDFFYLYAVGDKLYYRKYLLSEYYDKWVVCRINLDGSNEKQYMTKGFVHNVTVYGDWIYYNGNPTIDGAYKIKLDGSCDESIPNETYRNNIKDFWNLDSTSYETFFIDNIIGDNNNLYVSIYSDYFGSRKIYSTDESFNNIHPLSIGDVTAFNIKNDWVYYTPSSENNALYKTKVNENTPVKLCTFEGEICSINVTKDWVYFQIYKETTDTFELYRAKLDGTNLENVN